MIELQFQDSTGNWRTIEVLTAGIPGQVSMAMKYLKASHPEWRVRAIDENGRLIDFVNTGIKMCHAPD